MRVPMWGSSTKLGILILLMLWSMRVRRVFWFSSKGIRNGTCQLLFLSRLLHIGKAATICREAKPSLTRRAPAGFLPDVSGRTGSPFAFAIRVPLFSLSSPFAARLCVFALRDALNRHFPSGCLVPPGDFHTSFLKYESASFASMSQVKRSTLRGVIFDEFYLLQRGAG